MENQRSGRPFGFRAVCALKGGFVSFDLGMSQAVTSKKLGKGLWAVSGDSGKTRDKSQDCPLVPL